MAQTNSAAVPSDSSPVATAAETNNAAVQAASTPVATAAETNNADPAITSASAPHKPLAGLPNAFFSSVSVSAPVSVERVRSLESVEVEQLTQERLEEYWKQLLEEQSNDEKFTAMLGDKKVELQNNNLFLIKVPNIYFDTLIREFQERINTFFRKATNNEALQYRVAVEVQQRESVAYMPREKFDAMAQRNPAMYTLRKLFPDIDF